jgi:CubicO group peptidase (beta-lactamase class C family)
MKPVEARLQAIADDYTGQNLYAGIAWHVEKAGKLLASGTSGTGDEARKSPLGSDAIYRIYSMTKPVVSVMALVLVQRGQLRLSDFVMQYIPAFATTQVLVEGGTEAPVRPMTVEDLLTHRSGLSYDFVPDCPVAAQYDEIELIKRVE